MAKVYEIGKIQKKEFLELGIPLLLKKSSTGHYSQTESNFGLRLQI